MRTHACDRRSPNSRNRNQESADVDVDLSPQVNAALRSEILYYITSGIKESVRAVADELIAIPISGDNEKVLFSISCPYIFYDPSIRCSFDALCCFAVATTRGNRSSFGLSVRQRFAMFVWHQELATRSTSKCLARLRRCACSFSFRALTFTWMCVLTLIATICARTGTIQRRS